MIVVLLLLGVIFLSITARCDNGLDIADACKVPTPTATSGG